MKKKENKFTFVDLFAGIGGFRIPLEELGGECLGYSEINKNAISVYRTNFIVNQNNKEIELGDITKIKKLPFDVDIVVGGVPCQPWSIAGKIKGFDDNRGKLWFDVIRLLKKNQPKAFIFENVKGLVSPVNYANFEYLLQQLEESNYCVKWKVINSCDFGLPQGRERVFIVGIRNDLISCDKYSFPKPLNIETKLSDVIDEIKDCQSPKSNKFNDFFLFSDLRNGHTTIHSWDLIPTTSKEKLICLTMLKSRRSKKYGEKDGNPLSFEALNLLIPDLQEEDLIELVNKNILKVINDSKFDFVNSKNSSGINGVYRIFLPHARMITTLTATGTKDFIATTSINSNNLAEYKQKCIEDIYNQGKFKFITGQDARKLQGFPDTFILPTKDYISKQLFGNAVPIPVVYHVAEKLLEVLNQS
jgi:DNA (cytosine-5)-methyltransferase 1